MNRQNNEGIEFSVEQIQNAYQLAYFIHPQDDLAISVLVEGMERARLIAKTISKRPISSQPHKLPVLKEDLLHVGVLTASEFFEIYQESTGNPNQKKLAGYSSNYQPTPDDFVIRYIKKIYILSNDRFARYLAIGVGTLVYRYRTIDVLGLSDYFDNNNSSKIKKFYDTVMKNRGVGLLGFGEARGKGAAVNAMKTAIESRILDEYSIKGATSILTNFRCSKSTPLDDIEEAVSMMAGTSGENTDIYFGTSYNDLDDYVGLMFIATGDLAFSEKCIPGNSIQNISKKVECNNKGFSFYPSENKNSTFTLVS